MGIFDEKFSQCLFSYISSRRRIPRERCKGVHCVDLGERFPTHIFLQNLASIQPRTIPKSSKVRALGNLKLNFKTSKLKALICSPGHARPARETLAARPAGRPWDLAERSLGGSSHVYDRVEIGTVPDSFRQLEHVLLSTYYLPHFHTFSKFPNKHSA